MFVIREPWEGAWVTALRFEGKGKSLSHAQAVLRSKDCAGGHEMKAKKVGPRKLEIYLEKKHSEISDRDIETIRRRIEMGDGNVYKLASEFGCVPIQIAGVKASMHRK